jgi:flagellar hook-associated protein 2
MVGEARLTFNTTGTDVHVLIRATDTLSEMITRVNTQAGVDMSYDRLTDQFTLQARTGNNINPATTNLGIFSNSNFFNIIRGDVAPSEPIVRDGQQAKMIVNGSEEVFSNTNSFDFRGMNITLNRTFDGEAVNVNLHRDVQPAMNAIKDFIDSYNTIIKKLEDLLNERKGRNEVGYKPLTDEEKQGMTDRQIEEWEAIARKGIFRNDNGIQNLVSNLRRSFFSEIEGLGISPSQIGLNTGNFFDGTGGQIVINEDRLRDALERDPDMVADIFIRIDNSGAQPRGVGLMHKIDGLMRDYVNVSQTTSTRNLEQSLQRVNEQIERMQTRMFAEEDRLYRIFASMETAMQKLNQQGSFFNSMLGM